MRDYGRNEMYRSDDVDEYEEYEDEQEEEEGEEEFEEDPKPTKDELDYLALRQKLKENLRLQMKNENGASLVNSQQRKKKIPNDNYGNFFGPSQPVIAQRVIQESKSFLENQHLAARISSSGHVSKKASYSTNTQTRPAVRDQPPKVHEAKLKAQKLKNNRDYSFLLSEDSELPAPRKEPAPRNVSVRNSDARSAPVQPKSRQSGSNHFRPLPNGREERKHVPANHQMQTKASYGQVASGSRRPNMASADSRKHLGNLFLLENFQVKPPQQLQPRASMQVDRSKRRQQPYSDELDDEEDPMAIIRGMFKYDRRKFDGVDEDDSDMEANFDDIQREERRSAKIGHEEDRIEALKIEEEERLERLAKKRRLSQR
ncbi:hypothetical protein IFM89_008765 [Coptis chinensis]|uniref:Protein SPT2 homolog n=1 Tax=Coptis chinensis TaxID=261450 RepID=A0A835GVJ5_9MAGN|nr:hypothetical protein IFM89_008765 [Coptis chinensis]